jgi:small subunit ribosomal protein S5
VGESGAGHVLLRPASPGTGVIAGGAVRAVVESAGIHDVLSKSLGTSNAHNVVHATVAALKGLKAPESVANKRSKQLDEIGYVRRGGGLTAQRRSSVAPGAPSRSEAMGASNAGTGAPPMPEAMPAPIPPAAAVPAKDGGAS